ncbi:MAG: bifunctional UDP-N-acetylmuramoyl-tripeptide:D-alanyl-D-alanine ligase/alanine racemase [Bacteroidales bacterium]|nr:bifunctional UDP-N-acetylmuramoyl-tripeptide:D-alanyl-D-alanine ligase/alanine racemase [Bacteroidales bacterium]
MHLAVKKIARIIGAHKARIVQDAVIKRLLIDSRALLVSEGCLFFAIKTESNNGHKYLADLYKRGVRNFVISEKQPESLFDQANFLYVADASEALQLLGKYNRESFEGKVLGITGSNGKTIVKEWIWQLLRDDFSISRSPGSYNSRLGVPLSLSLLNDDSTLGLIEAGISQQGEMQKLQEMIQPDWGLLTHIGQAHQENFDSVESLIREKLLLFKDCERVVYCQDEEQAASVLSGLLEPERLLGWSCKDFSAKLYFRKDQQKDYTLIHTLWHREEVSFALAFVDEASVQNALHCIAFVFMLEEETDYVLDASVLARRLKQLEPVAMRMEVKEGRNGCVLIDDAYNSDLQALELALDFQSRRALAGKMQSCLILSDIFQSGKSMEDLYRTVAELIERKKIDRFVGIGYGLVTHAGFFPSSARFFLTTEDFLLSDLPEQFRNELILIKGSRQFGFERISERLELKAHNTVMEVDLNALVHNLNYFRTLIKPSTKVTAMVKAEAYGHGALEVSKTLQAQGCDALAVALVDEGVKLRRGGIHIPVLLMNPDPGIFPLCYEYKLEPEIYSFALLDAFIQAAERLAVRDFPVHIKLDTGMHRLGFTEKDLPRLLNKLSKQKMLRVSSVFSHLAGSDENAFDRYTQTQWELFEFYTGQFEQVLQYPFERHILNSAGIERFPQWQCDRVRLGIGLYGVSACNPEALQPVAALKTKILQIHEFKKGESIGYSRTVLLERDSSIATLPVGYGDGFNRHHSGGDVLVNGQRAKILGSICMDLCMVDVTDIQAQEGDTVVLFGKDLPLTELAERLSTISYEVLTSVSERVKRVYFKE